MALAVAVDVLPCLRIDEGELVGHGTQDGAIFEVKLVNVKGPSSTEQTPDAVELLLPVSAHTKQDLVGILAATCGRTTLSRARELR